MVCYTFLFLKYLIRHCVSRQIFSLNLDSLKRFDTDGVTHVQFFHLFILKSFNFKVLIASLQCERELKREERLKERRKRNRSFQKKSPTNLRFITLSCLITESANQILSISLVIFFKFFSIIFFYTHIGNVLLSNKHFHH